MKKILMALVAILTFTTGGLVTSNNVHALPLCRIKSEGGRSYASCVNFAPGDRARVVRVCQNSAGTRKAFYGNTLSSAGASVTQCYAPYYYYIFTSTEKWNIA